MKKSFIVFLMLCMGSLFNLHGDENMKRPVVVLETNKGNIEVTLFPDVAPKACENFVKLAEAGKYNNVVFHRIIPQFMIQGGDYTRQNGTGGESIWGKPFEDECTSSVKFDKPGLLAMANAGPKTNGSQFFITTEKTPWLQGRHTIFGEVTQGMDVVKALESTGTQSGRTTEMVKIVKAYVKEPL